jgi:YtxH-like protein
MADYYRDEHEGGGGFMMGLLTGTVLGAGLGMLLAPKSGSELRNQLTEGASSLGRRASGAVNDMSERARDTAHRGSEQLRGRGSDTSIGGRSGSSFGSGVGLGSTDTMAPGSGGAVTPGSAYTGGTSTGSTTGPSGTTGGSTYTGSTADIDPDRL